MRSSRSTLTARRICVVNFKDFTVLDFAGRLVTPGYATPMSCGALADALAIPLAVGYAHAVLRRTIPHALGIVARGGRFVRPKNNRTKHHHRHNQRKRQNQNSHSALLFQEGIACFGAEGYIFLGEGRTGGALHPPSQEPGGFLFWSWESYSESYSFIARLERWLKVFTDYAGGLLAGHGGARVCARVCPALLFACVRVSCPVRVLVRRLVCASCSCLAMSLSVVA